MSIPATTTARGTTVPTLGLGTWEVAGDDATEAVADALAAGYRHIDTAAGYDNEGEVGRGLARAGLARDDYWLTSKVKPDDFDDVRASGERSLRLLGVDHLDLLLLHWPVQDWSVVERALADLQQMRQDGLVREIGVSNFPPGLLRRALAAAPEILTDQVEYHVQLDQSRLLAEAQEHDLLLTAYSPLGNGRGLLDEPVLREVADEVGATPAQVAIAWLARQPRVLVIPRSTNPDRRRENLGALEVELSEDQVARIDPLTAAGNRVVDPPFAPDWDA